MKTKISNSTRNRANKIKAIFLILLTIGVAVTLIILAFNSSNRDYSFILMIIAAILIIFFGVFAFRRYKDADKGLAIEDERSKRVMEKAAYKTFLVSIYVLLGIGFLSENTIKFRDVSQATSMTIGILALVFFIFWVYYNNRSL